MFNNISLNTEATVTNPSGALVSAKEVLCAEKDTIKLGLESISAMVSNGFAKFIVSAVVSLLESILDKTCDK